MRPPQAGFRSAAYSAAFRAARKRGNTSHFYEAGGAIRATGRCDLYLGIGDRAGQQAGRMMNEGKLYYVFLKQSAMPAGTLSPTSPPGKVITPAMPK